MPKGHSRVIVVDFDGTIFDFNFPEIGPIKPGVIEALQRLRDAGWWIVISSCRSKVVWQEIYEVNTDGSKVMTPFEMTIQMADILDEYGVPYDEISMVDKPLALYYIDDRAIRLGCPGCGPNWRIIADKILEEGRELVDWLDLSANEIKEIEADEEG